jgi:hypothetical protein
MKKIIYPACVIISLFISGCGKDKIAIPASNPSQSTSNVQQSSLPHFNESNTALVAWDELPENLRKAPVMNHSENASKLNAFYKYTLGPWGGTGGTTIMMYPYAGTDRIYAIGFRSGNLVDAVTIWYARQDGTVYAEQAGGSGGSFYVQYFNADEYIFAIYGQSGTLIDHLGFYTNYKMFDYGGPGGTFFLARSASNDQIQGLMVNAGLYIDRVNAFCFSRL